MPRRHLLLGTQRLSQHVESSLKEGQTVQRRRSNQRHFPNSVAGQYQGDATFPRPTRHSYPLVDMGPDKAQMGRRPVKTIFGDSSCQHWDLCDSAV